MQQRPVPTQLPINYWKLIHICCTAILLLLLTRLPNAYLKTVSNLPLCIKKVQVLDPKNWITWMNERQQYYNAPTQKCMSSHLLAPQLLALLSTTCTSSIPEYPQPLWSPSASTPTCPLQNVQRFLIVPNLDKGATAICTVCITVVCVLTNIKSAQRKKIMLIVIEYLGYQHTIPMCFNANQS